MNMISEQVKELREKSWTYCGLEVQDILLKAADAMESLSAKLQAANMDQPKVNYSIWYLSELIDKFDNEKIKGITDFEQVEIFNALKYLDMYQKIGTIAEFMDLKQNVERSADYGGWILCKERLPEEKINPVTDDFYEYEVTFKQGNVTDIRHYKFGKGHWRSCGMILDDCVIAWREPLEPYHEP